MPLVRSLDNIPTEIQQESAEAALSLDNIAGGDAQNFSIPVDRPMTRLQSRREASKQNSLDNNQVRKMIDDSLRAFREEISDLITVGFRDLNINQRSVERDRQQNQSELSDLNQNRHDNRSSQNGQNESENRNLRNVNRDSDRNSERILNLIRNWRIHFTGDTSEVTVDEFIYRVNTLTNANLRGNFDLLCEHAHVLFEGKALKWFWRFHRSCDIIDWDELCDALKRQYKEYYTDFDIKQDILRRKQKSNESFDEFYDSIIVMCDRLRKPLSEDELCETIQRNLRPEIRHEILHLEINRISELRRTVRRHEKFVKDMLYSHTNKRSYQKPQVSEVIEEEKGILENHNFEEKNSEICLVVRSNKCWNCEDIGHSFIDCLQPRTVFCYGCGAKNVYKPQCPNCCKKQENLVKDVRPKTIGHPKKI